MKTDCSSKWSRVRALTLVEVLVIVAVVVMVAILLLPSTSSHGSKKHMARKIACAINLKQVGVAFKVWGSDNDRSPMRISVTNGGTMEYVGTPETFRHFQVMSNELNTPKILVCPADDERTAAASFSPHFSNSNLSYFVEVDAEDVYPRMFLSGDRNLTNGTALQNGMLIMATNRPTLWTEEMHTKQGNVLEVDGSVQGFSSHGLQTGLVDSGFATNRLAMP